MTFTNEVKVVQDFSGDREVLLAALRGIIPSPAAAASDANSELQALQNVAMMLEPIPGKKALIYFSNGVSRSGADQLKATTVSVPFPLFGSPGLQFV